MSKSLGNVISPYDLVKKYGTDATRYMLLRHVNPVEDSDVTWERLDEWYTANLTNGLGNLVARVMKLAEEYLPEPIADTTISESIKIDWASFDKFEFNHGLDLIWLRIGNVDSYMTESKPFSLIKTDKEAALKIICQQVKWLFDIGCALRPYMPTTAEVIITAVKTNKKPENLFPRLTA